MVMEIAFSLSRTGLRCRATFYPPRDSGAKTPEPGWASPHAALVHCRHPEGRSAHVFPAARRLDGSCKAFLITGEDGDGRKTLCHGRTQARSDARQGIKRIALHVSSIRTADFDKTPHGNGIIERRGLRILPHAFQSGIHDDKVLIGERADNKIATLVQHKRIQKRQSLLLNTCRKFLDPYRIGASPVVKSHHPAIDHKIVDDGKLFLKYRLALEERNSLPIVRIQGNSRLGWLQKMIAHGLVDMLQLELPDVCHPVLLINQR